MTTSKNLRGRRGISQRIVVVIVKVIQPTAKVILLLTASTRKLQLMIILQ